MFYLAFMYMYAILVLAKKCNFFHQSKPNIEHEPKLQHKPAHTCSSNFQIYQRRAKKVYTMSAYGKRDNWINIYSNLTVFYIK